MASASPSCLDSAPPAADTTPDVDSDPRNGIGRKQPCGTTHHAAELRAIRRPPPKDRRKIATNRPRPSSWCPITAAALPLPTLALVSQCRLVPPSTLIPALCLMPSTELRH